MIVLFKSFMYSLPHLNQAKKWPIASMLCSVYKSLVKLDTYLYVQKRGDFSKVPAKLLETFGDPVFVMIINLDKHQKLAIADKQKLIVQLTSVGFYLQIPPPAENLLKTHITDNKPEADRA